MRLWERKFKVGRLLWQRTQLACAWRIQHLANRLAARWGYPARLLRYPLPSSVPYRQGRLHVFRHGGLGDVLMCTPGLREVKRRSPSCHVTFYTDYPDLVAGLPFIDVVRPSAESPDGTIRLAYETSLPPHRHIARILGDRLGLHVADIRPECAVDRELVEQYRREWRSLRRPLVVVNRRAARWTPNKDWPDAHWEALIDRLLSWCTIIEVGAGNVDRQPRSQPSYLDLAGRTTLSQLVATIAASDLHVGPITGSVHIAAAVGTPSVVIYGGYEHPVCSAYPGNINLYSPVECAPCWLCDHCPYGKKCLHMITPAEVESALNRLWGENRRSPDERPAGLIHEGIPQNQLRDAIASART